MQMKGDQQQEAARDGVAGAELRQLEPAAAQGEAGRAQQLRRGVPGARQHRRPHPHDPARAQGNQGGLLPRLVAGK